MSPCDRATTNVSRRKDLGAFYTPPPIANGLARWAIRSPTDTVLDPSFGSLALLDAARERLLSLGATEKDAARRLYGVEFDEETFVAAALREPTLRGTPTLVFTDFLTLRPGLAIPAVHAVVGNPPFVRYQGFNGRKGSDSEVATLRPPVELTRLASSWAPFVVHAVSFVATGGRLAHVLPGQLLHAQYARPVMDFLRSQFHHIAVVAFEERVFPSAREEVVLVFADVRGAGPATVDFVSLRSLKELDVGRLLSRRVHRPPRRPGEERGKLLAELLPPRTRQLYAEAERAPDVRRLGDLAQVDIGTVTGANAFFMLDEDTAARFDPRLLAPAISKTAQAQGARFTKRDYRFLRRTSAATRLLVIDPDLQADELTTVDEYLRGGEAAGLHARYKCRARSPWWAIRLPRQPVPDLFLTYCAHEHPRLVLNEARVMHTNALHGVRVRGSTHPRSLAVGFYNSLTMLSAELLARSYGGGVLKLEPTEAEALLIPPLEELDDRGELLERVDALIRAGAYEAAVSAVDAVVLRRGLGLEKGDIDALHLGAERLRRRRHSRRRKPQPA